MSVVETRVALVLTGWVPHATVEVFRRGEVDQDHPPERVPLEVAIADERGACVVQVPPDTPLLAWGRRMDG